jgi:transketolase
MTAAMGKALRNVWAETLIELAAEDPRVVVLDGDLANSTKADLFEQAHPERFFQMGIAEQNMLGAAAGMAAVGMIPWISTFAAFAVSRALDPIRVLIAQPGLNVNITGAYSGLLAGKTGKTHLSFDDLAVMRALGNMTVVAPGDETETRQAVRTLTFDAGPSYLRLTREGSPVIFDDAYRFRIGRAVTVREGGDVTLVSTGVQTARVLESAGILEGAGIDCLVLHVPTIKPFDADAVAEAAARTGRVITVEEHSIIAGLGGAVAEALGALHPTRIDRIGLPDGFGESGPDDALLDKYGLSPQRVAAAIEGLLQRG